MKAITIRNPWAFWICCGLKDIENRTWKTNYRGRVLVHASNKFEEVPSNYFSSKMIKDKGNIMTDVIRNFDYQYLISETCGSILGSVEIVDCIIGHPSEWAEKSNIPNKPIYNWVLSKPILYKQPCFNVKGKLSFWESGYNEFIGDSNILSSSSFLFKIED